MKRAHNVERMLWAVVIAAALFLFFFRLGARPLRNPDEGRYAEIAREMLVSGDWLRPKLMGVDYLRKPPLLYWLIALSFKCFGMTAGAARFVPAIFGLATVIATAAFARCAAGPKRAFYAALMLATNVWFVQVGRYLLIDAVFTFFVAVALYLFYIGLRSGRAASFLGFYACLALAFLAKGPVGIILPVFAVFLYILFTRDWKMLLKIRPFEGAAVFLLIAAPWYAAILKAKPAFFEIFFINEHFHRLASSAFEHQEPWYFYLAALAAILLPWTLFPGAWFRRLVASKGRFSEGRLFWLAGLLSPVIFYSLSKAKLATYLLPSLPFACLLLADAWARWRPAREKGWARVVSTVLLAALFAFGITATLLPSRFFPEALRDLLDESLLYWRLLAAAAMAMAAAGLFLRARRTLLFYTMTGTMLVMNPLVSLAMESVNPDYTTAHFAEMLRPRLAGASEVLVYGTPGAFYDFPFYLNHPVRPVGFEGELELSKAVPQEIPPVRYEAFLPLVKSGRKVFVLMRKSDWEGLDASLKSSLRLIQEDDRKTLCESAGGGAA